MSEELSADAVTTWMIIVGLFLSMMLIGWGSYSFKYPKSLVPFLFVFFPFLVFSRIGKLPSLKDFGFNLIPVALSLVILFFLDSIDEIKNLKNSLLALSLVLSLGMILLPILGIDNNISLGMIFLLGITTNMDIEKENMDIEKERKKPTTNMDIEKEINKSLTTLEILKKVFFQVFSMMPWIIVTLFRC
jgi:hypothetical protein